MKILSISLLVFPILIDYFSKEYIQNIIFSDPFSLNKFIIINKTYNKGIAFGLFNFDSPLTNIFFIIIIIFIIIFIINFILKNMIEFNKCEFFAWHIIAGGAIANLIDRIIHGKVLDFIIIHYNDIYFPAVFNFADLFITAGVSLIIINYLAYKND